MTRYENRGGDSGVVAYEIGDNSIAVQFKDNTLYLYNYTRPGLVAVEHMKRLALQGEGLNSYISRKIKKNFAVKLK